MTFNAFVQKLYPLCSNGKMPADFVIEVLSEMTTEQDDSIFDKGNDYLKKIYNGTKFISQKSASAILTKIDKTKFDSFLYERLSDDALIELAASFESEIGNVTKDDVTTKLIDLLVLIMKQIATKRKGTTNTVAPVTNIDIEKVLAEIVNNLAKTPQEKLDVVLKYIPFNVDKKILSTNALLKKDIKDDVVDYYTYIEYLFKNATKENTSLFDRVGEAIKYASDNYISQGLPQQSVFDYMVAWLKQKAASANETACKIMISFFVQNCEVFHEIT
ncbi:MAG: hypothetical protein RR347_08900 [Anaerovoracaceae bacterium]